MQPESSHGARGIGIFSGTTNYGKDSVLKLYGQGIIRSYKIIFGTEKSQPNFKFLSFMLEIANKY